MSLEEIFEEQPTVSRMEAQAEVRRHGSSWSEFLSDLGDHGSYNGADVLGWLGY